jgi:cell division protein FtsL
MSNQIDVEYAIKKDVRNNPIVREADRRQGHEFIRTAGVWSLILSMGLFAAWQHFEVIRHGYEIEKVLKETQEEEAINRRLRLQIETLRSPERVERIATNDLRMIVPPASSTLVIERVAPASADKAIVARADVRGGVPR